LRVTSQSLLTLLKTQARAATFHDSEFDYNYTTFFDEIKFFFLKSIDNGQNK